MYHLTAVTLLAFASASLAQDSGNCTSFNWDKEPAYITSDKPLRVSGASSCSGSQRSCTISARGDGEFKWSTNITGLDTFVGGTDRDVLAEAVNSTVPAEAHLAPSFNSSVLAQIDHTLPLEAGETAYMNFTAYKFCYTGTVGSCQGNVQDDSPIEVCAPLWRDDRADGYPLIDGEYELVNISSGDAGNFQDPFQSQSRDEDAAGAASGTAKASHGLLAAAMAFAVLAM